MSVYSSVIVLFTIKVTQRSKCYHLNVYYISLVQCTVGIYNIVRIAISEQVMSEIVAGGRSRHHKCVPLINELHHCFNFYPHSNILHSMLSLDQRYIQLYISLSE